MGENNPMPLYLEPLMGSTPLAQEKLKEAWPGLAMGDRAYLLSVLLADVRKEPLALEYPHHRNSLIDLALSDENGYIRYLAAKHVARPDKDDDAPSTARYRRLRKTRQGLCRMRKMRGVSIFLTPKPGSSGLIPR
jgi:hypothetical protein